MTQIGTFRHGTFECDVCDFRVHGIPELNGFSDEHWCPRLVAPTDRIEEHLRSVTHQWKGDIYIAATIGGEVYAFRRG